MKHDKIEGIIQKRFEKLNDALEQVRLHFNEDDIRLFRVKVKKLAACLLLLEYAKSHDQALKLPSKIAGFYKLSGTIRTLQLQEKHIRKTLAGTDIELPEIYLTSIADKILQLIKKGTKLLNNQKTFKREQAKHLGLLPHHLGPSVIESFIASEAIKLKKLMLPVFPKDASLHEIRKTLKNLLYVSPYTQLDIDTFLPYSLLSTTALIDSFTVILGDFHDINMAIDCLHTECLNLDVSEEEKAVLRNIESQWMTEKISLHKKIYDHLQKIIASQPLSADPVRWPVL